MPVTIENICPDFFLFWDKAQKCSFAEQTQLWHTLYEDRHQEIFASYYANFPQVNTPDRLSQTLLQFENVLPRMRELAPLIKPLITHTTTLSASLLAVPDYILYILPYVVMVGKFIADGWSTESYQGRRTSFVALEDLARKYTTADTLRYLEILLVHEAAHSYHHSRANSNGRKNHIGEALFAEGIAMLTSAKAFPNMAESKYLWMGPGYEQWLQSCQQQWPELQKQLIQDFDQTDATHCAHYFQLFDKTLPLPRSGYFAGYQIVSKLNQHYSLNTMIH